MVAGGAGAVMRIDAKKFAQLSIGERRVVEWQLRTCGGFVRQLIELICKADDSNRLLLSAAFPSEVKAVTNYTNVEGWWPALLRRIEPDDIT